MMGEEEESIVIDINRYSKLAYLAYNKIPFSDIEEWEGMEEKEQDRWREAIKRVLELYELDRWEESLKNNEDA